MSLDQTNLLVAVESGDVARVAAAIRITDSVNFVDPVSRPVAILLETCRLNASTDMISRFQFGWTPLKKAALVGNLQVIEALLDAGAKPNVEAADKVESRVIGVGFVLFFPFQVRPALTCAASVGKIDIVDMLVHRGAYVDGHDEVSNLQRLGDGITRLSFCCFQRGYTALMAAAELGSVLVIQVLLRAGASVNVRDQVGCPELVNAHAHSGVKASFLSGWEVCAILRAETWQ
jgi:ankyrin repeat protein